jgi:hypothetical protein
MGGVVRRVTAAGWAQFGAAPSVEKALGSLPVVADFCRRLRIREVIDELCPMREVLAPITERLDHAPHGR